MSMEISTDIFLNTQQTRVDCANIKQGGNLFFILLNLS